MRRRLSFQTLENRDLKTTLGIEPTADESSVDSDAEVGVESQEDSGSIDEEDLVWVLLDTDV